MHPASYNFRRVTVDLTKMSIADWGPHLAGVDAVINCAGVLQDNAWDSTGVHAEGAANLFTACEKANVTQAIHFSAIGVDRETPTRFSASKAAGDQALMRTRLNWVILRPSVIVGRPAYGGSALIRGLASLPVLPEGARSGSRWFSRTMLSVRCDFFWTSELLRK